jgi:hypothetical protein
MALVQFPTITVLKFSFTIFAVPHKSQYLCASRKKAKNREKQALLPFAPLFASAIKARFLLRRRAAAAKRLAPLRAAQSLILLPQ